MGSVQISVVFAKLQEAILLDFLLHVLPLGEPIGFATFLQRSRRTGCIYNLNNILVIVDFDVFFNPNLTWQNRRKLVRIAVDEAILQRSPTHARHPDQHQRFPLERWHLGNFLVQHQIGLVELAVLLGFVHGFAFLLGNLAQN